MMREPLLKLVQFVSIMLYVLVAGVMWGTWLSLARTMTSYDAATFLADGQHMINNLATVMAVLMISAVLALQHVTPDRTYRLARFHVQDEPTRRSRAAKFSELRTAPKLEADAAPVGPLASRGAR